MNVLGAAHARLVHGNRVERLAAHLARHLPAEGTALDVGCGDGWLTRLVADARPALAFRGIDVLVRPNTHVPVSPFDGHRIPEGDGAVDAVMLVDVVHHASDPLDLLREAARVARKAVVIKDHTRQGLLAGPTLRFMDFVGNAHHGVSLPYNYWTEPQWRAAFEALGLTARAWETDLRLYPAWADWLFGRGLHFVAVLERSSPAAGR